MRVTTAMAGNQLRLVGRSARTLVRHPSLGRDLPRLAATRGRSTMRLRLPWLPFRLVDELSSVVGPGTRVFEYGGGGSTLWFLDRGAEVVTVEHHDGWADELEAAVGGNPRWTLLRRGPEDHYEQYVAAIDGFPDDRFDVVVVDGRERARCVLRARPKVAPGGVLLVDDIDRERYWAAVEATPWPRRDVVGFAPAKPSLAHTAVLSRPRD